MFKLYIKILAVMLFVSSFQLHYSRLFAAQNNRVKYINDTKPCVVLHECDAKRLIFDDLILAFPTEISYHKDGFLLISDRQKNKQLNVIDLVRNTCVDLVNKGRAENELISLWDVSVRDDDIYLSSMIENKVIKLKYDSEERSFTFDSSILLPNQFMRCVANDSGFVTLASASSGERFSRYDDKGNYLDSFGTFPSEGIKNYKDANNGIFQSDISLSPDGVYMVSAYKTIDYIDIYCDKVLKERLRGPKMYTGTINSIEVSEGRFMYSLFPMNFACKGVIADDSGFWVGFIGKELKKGEIPTPDMNQVSEIFHLDWNGNVLETYELETPVDAFTIDHETATMYCVINSPEPHIVMYKLTKR